MPTPTVCFYDDPYVYDSDVYWDGSCSPEASPVEVPLIQLGRSRRPTPNKIYCRFEVNTLYCYYNGNVVPIETTPIRFECEEEEGQEPQIVLESIEIRRKLTEEDTLEVIVENMHIATEDFEVRAEVRSVKPLSDKIDELDIVVENFKVKSSIFKT